MKHLSTICMIIGFVFGTIILPYQQRQLFVSVHFNDNDNHNQNQNNHIQQEQLVFDSVKLILPKNHEKQQQQSNNIYNNDQRRNDIPVTPTTTTTTTTATTTTNTGSANILPQQQQQRQQSQSIESSTVQLPPTTINQVNISIVDTTLQSNSNNIFSGIRARSFVSNTSQSMYVPCYPSNSDWGAMNVQNSPAQRGFFYLKPYKTGSSTTSGVHLRIARNVAHRRKQIQQQREQRERNGSNVIVNKHQQQLRQQQQQQQFNTTTLSTGSTSSSSSSLQICESRFDHGPNLYAGYSLFRNRIKNESFLWTILRDPTKRAISQFFHFDVSRNKIEPTDTNFIKFLRSSYYTKDYYLRALHIKDKYDRTTMNPITTANTILRTFDFIGVTERIDESFVVLMMILHLRMSDILYLSAKSKGGFDDGGGRTDNVCTYIWPSFVSNGVQQYLNSTEWKEIVRYDTLLYQAVNRSLDLTIDELGRDQFNRLYQKYLHAQKIANEKCFSNAIFPCDAGGTLHNERETDCIWKDSGCGVSCLDSVATELNLW
jgi:hypothetical protein